MKDVIIIILFIVMGISAIGMLSVATIEFLKSLGEREKKVKKELEPVSKRNEQETVVEDKQTFAVEETPQPDTSDNQADENAVSFGISATARLTLEEEYKRASRKKKKWFEKITEELYALEKIRIKEGKYALTAVQGQDTVAKIQFVKGEICVDCTLVNSDLKTYGKESGTKIKQKPMRFKIVDESKIDPALFTIKVANQTALDARAKRKSAKKNQD